MKEIINPGTMFDTLKKTHLECEAVDFANQIAFSENLSDHKEILNKALVATLELVANDTEELTEYKSQLANAETEKEVSNISVSILACSQRIAQNTFKAVHLKKMMVQKEN